MKCCDMTAGMLRNKISIERLTRTADGIGGFTEAWAEIGTEWAYVKGLTGTERWEAMRIMEGNLTRAVTRFRGDAYGAPFYSASDRVKFRNREYNILSVMDIESDQKWLQIDMMEGKGS